jgi:hypothetical protein
MIKDYDEEAKTDEPQTPRTEIMHRLDKAIEVNQELCGQLVRRLLVVMGPEHVQQEELHLTPSDAEFGGSMHIQDLLRFKEKVGLSSKILEDILDRLEV